MRTTRFVALSIALLAMQAVASAKEVEADRQRSLQPMSSADGQSSGPTFLDAATIEAGTADTKASIGISGYLPGLSSGSWYHQYSLGGEAAISKGSNDDAIVGSLSGLSKGSSAHASLSWIYWPRMSGDEATRRMQYCEQKFVGLLGDIELTDAPLGGADIGCDASLFTEAKLKEIADSLEASRKACKEGKAQPGTDCARVLSLPEARIPDNIEIKKVLKILQSEWAALQQALSDEGFARAAQFFSVSAKTNRAKANYFVDPDYTKVKKDRTTGYGGTASYSLFRGRHLFSLGFSFEKTFKANDDSQVCTPLTNSTSLKCITAPIGAPTHSFARIAFSELRWLVAGGRVGIAPRAEYDFTGSDFAVRVPIYLAPDKKKSLIGGIALGYSDKDDEGFGISVFVGKAFSFFD